MVLGPAGGACAQDGPEVCRRGCVAPGRVAESSANFGADPGPVRPRDVPSLRSTGTPGNPLLAIKMEKNIPLYIVGMPEEQENVDLITSKFNNTLKRIQKVYSEIQEAKISLKKRRSGSKNKRGGMYDVSVMITTPHYHPFTFKEAGWDLSQVFETLSQRMLRRLSKRAKRRFKTSIRKIEVPGLIVPV